MTIQFGARLRIPVGESLVSQLKNTAVWQKDYGGFVDGEDVIVLSNDSRGPRGDARNFSAAVNVFQDLAGLRSQTQMSAVDGMEEIARQRGTENPNVGQVRAEQSTAQALFNKIFPIIKTYFKTDIQ